MKITTNTKIFDRAITRALREFLKLHPEIIQTATHFRYKELYELSNWMSLNYGIRAYSKGYDRYIQPRKSDWCIDNEKKYMLFLIRYSE